MKKQMTIQQWARAQNLRLEQLRKACEPTNRKRMIYAARLLLKQTGKVIDEIKMLNGSGILIVDDGSPPLKSMSKKNLIR